MNWRWMHPDYETKLAIVFTFLSALIPWGLARQSVAILNYTSYHARWWLGEAQYVSQDASGFVFLNDLIAAQADSTFYAMHLLWGTTTAVFTLGLIYALLLIVHPDQMTQTVPARVMAGGLLTLTGSGYFAINLWMTFGGIPGIYLPLGALMTIAFGAFLLTNRIQELSDIKTGFNAITA